MPDKPAAVPVEVLHVLCRQSAISDPDCLQRYSDHRRWIHAADIQERYGYRHFTDPGVGFRLSRWLYALCWTGTNRPGVLFERASTWLLTHEVLLPGVFLNWNASSLYEHINMLGRYSFAVPEEVARGELRPLRNPDDEL
ncbi:DUF4158 domain-containing protein [Pseudomonas stutzeri]|nr:DUF4158 domain-containing protein [Stutzerimonas stutzeri]MCQ4318925.1 DUF4158 domain-containing protein [Stutzerimonas stutzeri]